MLLSDKGITIIIFQVFFHRTTDEYASRQMSSRGDEHLVDSTLFFAVIYLICCGKGGMLVMLMSVILTRIYVGVQR